MIIADDLNDWVGCLGGHPDAKTPNIDRLAQRGLLFTNAHCRGAGLQSLASGDVDRAGVRAARASTTTRPFGIEMMPGIASIPQHFKANGYYTAGGGKVYHHHAGIQSAKRLERVLRSGLRRALSGETRPRRGRERTSLARRLSAQRHSRSEIICPNPPDNAKEFDWGPLDKPDNEMGDGQMVQWAEKFLARATQAAVFPRRRHLPTPSALVCTTQVLRHVSAGRNHPAAIKEDDLDDLPEPERRWPPTAAWRLELVTNAGQYQRVSCRRIWPASRSAMRMVGRLAGCPRCQSGGGEHDHRLLVRQWLASWREAASAQDDPVGSIHARCR